MQTLNFTGHVEWHTTRTHEQTKLQSVLLGMTKLWCQYQPKKIDNH